MKDRDAHEKPDLELLGTVVWCISQNADGRRVWVPWLLTLPLWGPKALCKQMGKMVMGCKGDLSGTLTQEPRVLWYQNLLMMS